MAFFTIQLRNVIDIYGRDEVESWFKDYQISDYLTPEQIQSINEHGIWNKDKLAKRIVDHYFMREIGFETPVLFANRAKCMMEEIMEEYLPLIYSNSIKFDPLVNVDYEESFERFIDGKTNSNEKSSSKLDNTGKSTSNSDSNGSNLSINNNTPQTNITKQNLDSGIYASSVGQNDSENHIEDETNTKNHSENEVNTSNSGTSNSEETYKKRIKGNSGVSATAQALILQYRDTIRAVNNEIILKLNVLFMGIFK